MILLAFSLLAVLIWFSYLMYDYWLKKILGWDNIKVRKDIFYFMKHKKEIREYIENATKNR